MSYFRASYQMLQVIARSGRFEDLAAFLVIARHANGRPPSGIAPHTVSGAGVNAVHEKAGLSEETARGAIQRLQTLGFIQSVTDEQKKASFSARWQINHADLDLDLPHLFTDSVEGMSGVLRRIRTMSLQEARRYDVTTNLSDTELRLDVLTTLLVIYRHTSMSRYGGLSPRCCYRAWEVKSKTPKTGGVRWGAEPENEHAFYSFMAECLSWTSKEISHEPVTPAHQKRFWAAWNGLKETGLIYEAVSWFDVDPAKNEHAQLIATLRVNDYHAGSAGKNGDPSLLRELETGHGAKYSYYTAKKNAREEEESMWVVLPNAAGFFIGIWRPRMRAATADAGSWFDAETIATRALRSTIENLQPAYD